MLEHGCSRNPVAVVQHSVMSCMHETPRVSLMMKPCLSKNLISGSIDVRYGAFLHTLGPIKIRALEMFLG
jgi:hypothetical protein